MLTEWEVRQVVGSDGVLLFQRGILRILKYLTGLLGKVLVP